MSTQDRPSVIVVGHDHLPGLVFLGVGLLVGWLVGSSKRTTEPAQGAGANARGRWSGLRTGALNESMLAAKVDSVDTIIDLGGLAEFYKEAAAAIDLAITKIAAAGGANPTSPLYPVYTYLVNLRLALDRYAEGQANQRLQPVLGQLTQLGSTLKTQAQAIPDATAGLNDLNSFLGTITSIVGLLKT